MIGGEHTVQVACTPGQLWDFMEHFPHWATYVVGYESFRVIDDTTSAWTLRGDVGILSREVEIEVTVTSWDAGRSAMFALEGVTERLSGTGSFEVFAEAPDQGQSDPTFPPTEVGTPVSPPRTDWWARVRRRFGRWMIRRAQGAPGPSALAKEPMATTQARAGSSWLRFRLEVTPGGPMAPMLEMLMAPLLQPAAEDLSLRIREAIEGRTT